MKKLSTHLNIPFFRRIAVLGVLTLCAGLLGATAQSANAQNAKLVLDDFENGTGKWSVNDNTATGGKAASLIEVFPSGGSDLVPGSRGAGLFTFKAAKNSWASASLRVNGSDWAKIGARALAFYLNAGGNDNGVDILIRRTWKPGQDEVFRLPWTARLDIKKWRKVVIPLSDFKSERDKAPLNTRLKDVYLVQFVMRGSWDARFFRVDQMQIEGTGQPIDAGNSNSGTVAPTPKPTPKPDSGNGVTTVNVDFLRTTGRIRAAANVSIGSSVSSQGSNTFPLQDNATFRAALRELKPRYLRLDAGDLSTLLDSGTPSFDFSRLKSAVKQARALGAQPLVVVPTPNEWNLDARGYASFAAQAARAANERGVGPVRYFELATASGDLSDSNVVSYYNSARAAVRKVSSTYRVGGVTASTGRTGTQRAILRGASGLDFLSVLDYSAYGGEPSDEILLKTARGVERLRTTAANLDKSKFRNAALFVVTNLNAARADGMNAPSDPRVVQMISGAWWASYMAGASRLADQIFHNDASTPEWGLLDSSTRAYPSYYAMWLWNTFVPSGSTRVKTETNNSDILAYALNSPTAHNLLLVNTTPEDKTAQIGIRGFPVLREARIRIYDDSRSLPRLAALPKSPYQTILLRPYAVAVVQFIEPPKG